MTVSTSQDVSFSIGVGEVLGLVGESGSGKTTLGRLVLRLIEPSAGRVRFEGVDLLALDPTRLRAVRQRMQIIFQDPFSSLNPTMTVGAIIGEGLDIHGVASGRARAQRVRALLQQVGLPDDAADRYPHEFSGGRRQRVGIARALSVSPRFIVADEPVSALDVSVQAQVVNLLQDLQAELGLGMLFIARDLPVVEHIADRVMVMYLGRVMEIAPSRVLYAAPRHPYTIALMSAAPTPDPLIRRDRVILKGDIPSPLNPPSGCVFRTRCPSALPTCADTVPLLQNSKRPPLGKKEVRQAIAYAIDRSVILRDVMYGYGVPATGPLSRKFAPEGLYTDDVRKFDVPDRVAIANKLLDDAGVSRGANGMRFAVHLEVNSFGEQWLRQAEYIKQALVQVGIDVTLRSEDTAGWLRRVYTDYDYDISEPFLGQGIDPVIGLNREYLSSQIRKGVTFVNNSFYSNPEIDKLLGDGAREIDPKTRGDIYKKVQQILAEDSPLIWLVDVQYVSIYNKKLHNHTTGPLGTYQAFEQAWLEK